MKKSDAIGQFIREKRNKLGLNQADLAEVSGITAKALSGIENSRVDPKHSTVERLLENLGYRIMIVSRTNE